jgi:WD40 repeat protein
MTKKLPALVLTGLAAWIPAWAHHSFTAQFDAKKPITLKGTVTGMDWINPHAWIHMAVKGADGKVENWMVETGSPNILVRRGFTKKSLEEGTEIVVQGYMAKSGENKINGGSVVFPDGRQLFVGGSNPDDPGQGK